MAKKNIKNLYRFLKVQVKRTASSFDIIRKLRYRGHVRKNERNKKMFNFVLADDFIKEFKGKDCKKYKDVEGYYIHLYEFNDAYLANCMNCAFVQKLVNNKLYTFKESSGLNARLDEPDMNYAPPFDLTAGNHQEEDEVCLLCFLLGENYWHYVFDIIPRLMVMVKRGYKGKFLVNNTDCAKQFLELLKIPEDRLIINQYGSIIHAKKVYMFSDMYGIELHGQLLVDTRKFLIEEAEKNYGSLLDKSYPKKIFVSRVSRRKITNEEEIIKMLKSCGFKVIVPEKLSLYEQMKSFHNADIIVTPHGANSTNLLFCRERTSMIECFSHQWINPCMMNTVGMLNIDYHMICERLADYQPNAGKFTDYKINTFILENKVKKVMELRDLMPWAYQMDLSE